MSLSRLRATATPHATIHRRPSTRRHRSSESRQARASSPRSRSSCSCWVAVLPAMATAIAAAPASASRLPSSGTNPGDDGAGRGIDHVTDRIHRDNRADDEPVGKIDSRRSRGPPSSRGHALPEACRRWRAVPGAATLPFGHWAVARRCCRTIAAVGSGPDGGAAAEAEVDEYRAAVRDGRTLFRPLGSGSSVRGSARRRSEHQSVGAAAGQHDGITVRPCSVDQQHRSSAFRVLRCVADAPIRTCAVNEHMMCSRSACSVSVRCLILSPRPGQAFSSSRSGR